MSRHSDTFETTPDGTLGSPWLEWTTTGPTVDAGKVLGTGDASRPESIGPDSFFEAILSEPMTLATAETFGVGIRLTAHSGAADGYMLEVNLSGGLFVPKLYKSAAFTTLATGGGRAEPVDGIRIVATGTAITGYFRIGGLWTEVVAATDASYGEAGYPGFWVQNLDADIGIDSVSWGDGDGSPGSASARFFARLEPLAYDDDGTLANMASALLTPVEIGEIARDSDTHIAWGALRDPDACPAELLDWLAVDQGIVFPPSALTEAEKRYRIKQAAGRYRGTPRALVEEVQLVLTGTKTVLLGYHNGDEWHYLVGTLTSETTDAAAVERAVLAQNPAFMVPEVVNTDDWVWFVLAPTLIATRVDDAYEITTPDYPTWQDVIDNFDTWQDLIDNTPS